MNTPRFFININPMIGTTEIRFGCRQGEGRVISAEPVKIKIEQVDPNTMVHTEPMMSFDHRDAQTALQSLMDELWKNGYRPADIGTAGHLAATQAHLADMRKLVLENKNPIKL